MTEKNRAGPNRRAVLAAAAGAVLTPTAAYAAPADSELTWMPAWRVRELIAARKLSPVEVIDHFLARIEALNPKVGAFDYVMADEARAAARSAEDAVMTRRPVGPLHGLPVSFKSY